MYFFFFWSTVNKARDQLAAPLMGGLLATSRILVLGLSRAIIRYQSNFPLRQLYCSVSICLSVESPNASSWMFMNRLWGLTRNLRESSETCGKAHKRALGWRHLEEDHIHCSWCFWEPGVLSHLPATGCLHSSAAMVCVGIEFRSWQASFKPLIH